MQNPVKRSDDQQESANTLQSSQPTVRRCLSGSLVAGAISIPLYLLTLSIAQTFANKPVRSGNLSVVNIAVAVRTLVVGMSALGTGIFGLVAIGLVGLAIQILIQRFMKQLTSSSDI